MADMLESGADADAFLPTTKTPLIFNPINGSSHVLCRNVSLIQFLIEGHYDIVRDMANYCEKAETKKRALDHAIKSKL